VDCRASGSSIRQPVAARCSRSLCVLTLPHQRQQPPLKRQQGGCCERRRNPPSAVSVLARHEAPCCESGDTAHSRLADPPRTVSRLGGTPRSGKVCDRGGGGGATAAEKALLSGGASPPTRDGAGFPYTVTSWGRSTPPVRSARALAAVSAALLLLLALSGPTTARSGSRVH
jgi:hypothetical protein